MSKRVVCGSRQAGNRVATVGERRGMKKCNNDATKMPQCGTKRNE